MNGMRSLLSSVEPQLTQSSACAAYGTPTFPHDPNDLHP